MKRLTIVICLSMVISIGVGQRSRFAPDFATVQYAGSIGFCSGGLGYNIFKNQAMLSLHYGYVPYNKGGTLNILASKLIFKTIRIPLSSRMHVSPFDPGIMLSYHFGSQFSTGWPDRYPPGYYWWSTAFRIHISTQTSLTYKFDSGKFESVTCFVDLNTNELYLVSYLQNTKSLTLRDIIKVGYGVRLNF